MSEKVVDKKLPSYLLSGKTAIVTGASRGIGRATAIRLAEAGANVVVNYFQHQGDAEEVVAECEKIGGKAIAVQGNVAVLADAKHLIDKALEEFGGVDILVANAGISGDTSAGAVQRLPLRARQMSVVRLSRFSLRSRTRR